MKLASRKPAKRPPQKSAASADAYIQQLFDVICSRKLASPEKSYVKSLFDKGSTHIARKLGEEAIETILAAESGKKKDLICESADLLFHLLVLWAAKGLTPAMIIAELQRREGTSGIAEKQSRR